MDQHIKEVEIGEDWRARRTEEERARMLKENAPVIEAIAHEVNWALLGGPCNFCIAIKIPIIFLFLSGFIIISS